MGNLTLSVFDVVFLFICAVIVGIVIHFFITSRRHLNKVLSDAKGNSSGMNEWKLKYLNDMEEKEKRLDELRQAQLDLDETNRIYKTEIEELRRQIKKLSSELETSKSAKLNTEGRSGYYEQLLQAQQSLQDHNQKITQLLQQVDVIKETEEKNLEVQRSNEELSIQINDLKYLLGEKEDEINQIKQKENLTREMSSMLDNAYSEFNLLQTKIQKLELQLTNSRMSNIEYEDLKESYYKMSREFDETRQRLNHYMQENQNLQIELAKSEDRLSEANLQRQQLQKKVAYLEELTNDLQQMSEANKKLEGQIRRIGELESRLNLVSEERDKLRNTITDG